MSSRVSLRLVTTNDFMGSFFAGPTSYGTYPGVGALVETVDRLREDVPALLWIDDGDFSQGGPLAPVSGGTYGFVAVAELGIDAAVVGNHELDWGERHLVRWGGETGFPLVVANRDIGLPRSVVLPAGPFAVGIVGLTEPSFGSNRATPAETIIEVAGELRAAGADVVVAAVHDGVDWRPQPRGPAEIDTRRMATLCAAVRGHADVVLAGHTLGRHIGSLAGMPFCQPWPFGAELGVLDRGLDGAWRAYGVSPGGDRDWSGHGSRLNAVLSAEIVGEVAEPLGFAPGRDLSLGRVQARTTRKLLETDVAVAFPAAATQAAIDGVWAYLPAGPVSEAQVLRLLARDWDIVVSDITREEFATLLERSKGRPGAEETTLGLGNLGGLMVDKGDLGRKCVLTIAVGHGLCPMIEGWLGRSPEWSATEHTETAVLKAGIAPV